MSDDTEQSAVPVEDAATDHPPTVDEVLDNKRREHPDQSGTREEEGKDATPPAPERGARDVPKA